MTYKWSKALNKKHDHINIQQLSNAFQFSGKEEKKNNFFSNKIFKFKFATSTKTEKRAKNSIHKFTFF